MSENWSFYVLYVKEVCKQTLKKQIFVSKFCGGGNFPIFA